MMNGKPKAVSVAVIADDGLLLVERANQPARNMYAFPGGRVEADETLEEAARRELHEETGLVAAALEAFETYDLEAFLLTVFLAKSVSGALLAADDAKSAAYHRLSDALALPMPGSMHDCIGKLVARGVIDLNPANRD